MSLIFEFRIKNHSIAKTPSSGLNLTFLAKWGKKIHVVAYDRWQA
jgi:hypothetical protein